MHIFSPTIRFTGRLPVVATLLATLLTLAGCASVPPPNDAMNEAQALLQTARTAGAADYAPVDLGFAQDKFQQAQTAFSDGKYDDANNLAQESRADSELATAKARLGAVRAQIQNKTQDNAGLRAEGQQMAAAAQQQAQQDQQQLQQMQQQQQQADPAGASSIPTPTPPDMPAPSSSSLSEPAQGGDQSGDGFQTMPTQTLPDQVLPAPAPASTQSNDPNNPAATDQGGHP